MNNIESLPEAVPHSEAVDIQLSLRKHRKNIIKSLKAEADSKRNVWDKAADKVTAIGGSTGFLVLNTTWFIIWIVINVGYFPGIKPFDPFPFGLLTMIVSLEAIILSIVVLVSQNRSSRVDDLREETNLQLTIITEQEITKMMKMIALLMEKNGMDLSKDKELLAMLKPVNVEKIKTIIEDETKTETLTS